MLERCYGGGETFANYLLKENMKNEEFSFFHSSLINVYNNRNIK